MSLKELLQNSRRRIFLSAIDAGGTTPGELAERLNLSAPTISAELLKLQVDGFVARRFDEGDRRKVRIFVTTRGQQLLESND